MQVAQRPRPAAGAVVLLRCRRSCAKSSAPNAIRAGAAGTDLQTGSSRACGADLHLLRASTNLGGGELALGIVARVRLNAVDGGRHPSRTSYWKLA